MSGVTGIELGPNYCVLVRGGRLGSQRTVSAAAAIAPTAWPDDPHALAERLRAVRTQEIPEPSAHCFMESWPRAWPGVECRGRGDGPGRARATRRRWLRDRFCGLSSASARASGPGTSGRCAVRNGSCRALVEQSRGRDCDCLGHRSHPLANRRVVARDTVRRQAGRTFRTARSLPPRFADCAAAPTRYRSRPARARRDGDFRHGLRQPARPAFDRDAPHRGDGHRSGNARLAGAARSGVSRRARSRMRSRRSNWRRQLPRRARTACLFTGKRADVRDERATRGAAAEDASGRARISRASRQSVSRVLCRLVVIRSPARRPRVRFRRRHRPDPGAAAARWHRDRRAGAASGSHVRTLRCGHPRGADLCAGVRRRRGRSPEPAVVRPGNRRPNVQGSPAGLPAHRRRHHDCRNPAPGDRRWHRRRPGDPVGTRAIARIERDGVVLREPSGREIYVAIRPRKPPALGS